MSPCCKDKAMQRRIWPALGVLCTLGLLGCSSPAAPKPVWATYSGGVTGDAGLLEGFLMVTEDGCLTLVDDQGQVWLPILPAKGVTAAPEGISFDGEVFEHEERVGLGGGEAGSLDSP